MKRNLFLTKKTIFILIVSVFILACNQNTITIEDAGGELGKTGAPVSVKVKLTKSQVVAAKKGSLALFELATKKTIPVQFVKSANEKSNKLVFTFPKGNPGTHTFKFIELNSNPEAFLEASHDLESGQSLITEDKETVLQYNYQTVYEQDVIRTESQMGKKLEFGIMSGVYYEEYLKAHPELEKNDTTRSDIYSVPRSDYIHPLYGLNGEMLTDDWPDGGHPHHRGIFWAWPELEYKGQRGDIYALQRVFARPTGNIAYVSGPVFAQIDAENTWMWEDKEAIVQENATIRVYRATVNSRIIDLTIKLKALKEDVTIATRFTNSYGGLNIRLQSPDLQDISYFTDKEGASPVRAWSDFNGIFEGNDSKSGLMVLQHKENPEYPGAWRDYPSLAWVQPTFPSPETRYALSTKETLTLNYRLIVHAGGKPSKVISEQNWDAYHNCEITFSE